MAIRVALHHLTEYSYDRLVTLSPHMVRLRPAPHCRTPIRSYSLNIKPDKHFLNWQQDPYGNYIGRLVFPEETEIFSVEVDLVADMTVINPFDFFLEPSASEFPFDYEPELKADLTPFFKLDAGGPVLEKYVAAIPRDKKPTNDFLVELNQRLQKDIGYIIRMEPGVQTCEETLESRQGSCRDTAWLLAQILRRLGLASRFVSGYLIQLKPDVKPLEGPAGAEQDFTDLHAWTEVFLPGAGWVGLDPTSGLLAAEGHLPVACTPDPLSAAPVSGSMSHAEVKFRHEMSVRRIHEDPRVTKPYTEEQWNEIEALGHRIDEELLAGDVRLTMGGEPTFVSIDDMDGPEWNYVAAGPDKRRLAEQLIHRLQQKFAPGGLLHFGEGKWYPGESLPRWTLACYWRKDGIPLWRDLGRIADSNRDYGYGPDEAHRFTAELALRLGLDTEYLHTAYEDPMHFLEKEGQLPINVVPGDSRMDSAEERDRMRRVFQRGLSRPAGCVLPIERGWGPNAPMWQSGLWMLRGQPIFLIPGDSPVGLRLPLKSLPWVEPRKEPVTAPPDPLAPRDPLPDPRLRPQTRPVPRRFPENERSPETGESAEWVVRTALCVECRDGRLHVFMPPLTSADDYVELLATVEDTAVALDMSIIVEGYTPPFDHRLNNIKVTPDPGVLEVNIHPAANWDELVTTTNTVYEEARQTRLGTEKFMLDGRHSGTGGGNHFVLGGPTPADSPFLRRPDLLRSLIAYWVNHPSLSYLFSGMFIGPTSQSPRVDETRQDSLYELEIAFAQVDASEETCPPWLVDRIFRHLLVDVTGNTHRAEFCIDKLYAPETATGRLGLLELRSFEMPPHARMSLSQQLLMRALVAWFWREPYRAMPTEWGTRLHDEFMLPHYIWKDFSDITADLRRAGYPILPEWFASHFEFRYPVLGHVNYQGIEIELRQATEPWYVLGEEPGATATARYVDSSVERVQLKAQGLTGQRHIITCNSRALPLRPTGTEGESVAGVRYRAWQPPSCLHPTIPVHTPLIFDVVDTWASRSIGGCAYHVAHPGGRSHDTLPVNAMEAEARRTARFFPFGHTPGPMQAPLLEVNPRFPTTLDLRRTPGS